MNQQDCRCLVDALVMAAYDSGFYCARAESCPEDSEERRDLAQFRDAFVVERKRLYERLLRVIECCDLSLLNEGVFESPPVFAQRIGRGHRTGPGEGVVEDE